MAERKSRRNGPEGPTNGEAALRLLASHLKLDAQRIERQNTGDPGFTARVTALKGEHASRRAMVTTGIVSPEEMDHLLAVETAELERQSGVDPLTGISNRYRFERDSDRVLSIAQRQGNPVTVIAFDIDDFKAVNDAPGQGHPVGDAVLMHLASHVQSELRDGVDAFGRLSGGADEFAITLPNMNLEQALEFIGRVKQDLSSNITEAVTGMDLDLAQTVTISAGIVTTDILNGDYSRANLMRAADNALYAAKQTGKNIGKNQVAVYNP